MTIVNWRAEESIGAQKKCRAFADCFEDAKSQLANSL
jgi:hypothetical protein